MRCPYCDEDIHDQSVKCPFCERLLVERPGWRKSREQGAAVAATRTPPPRTQAPRHAAPPRARPRTAAPGRSGPPPPRTAVLGVALLFVAAALGGYILGRLGGPDAVPTPATPPATVIQGDDPELVALAEEQRAEIRRLQAELREAEQQPTDRELETALGACEQALTLVIEREASLFSTDAGRAQLVQLANRCLAPTGKEVESLG